MQIARCADGNLSISVYADIHFRPIYDDDPQRFSMFTTEVTIDILTVIDEVDIISFNP